MTGFSLTGIVEHLLLARAELDEHARRALERASRVVETEAKHEIGTYQNAVGPFPAWEPLAETTLEGWRGHPGKEELGYAPPDNPLLRDGELRESIGHVVGDMEAEIGTSHPAAAYLEHGTEKMPPRPFVGAAAARKTEEVVEILRDGVVSAMITPGKLDPL